MIPQQTPAPAEQQLTAGSKRPLSAPPPPSAGSAAARQKVAKTSASSTASSSSGVVKKPLPTSMSAPAHLSAAVANSGSSTSTVNRTSSTPALPADPSPVKYLQDLFNTCETGRRIMNKRPRGGAVVLATWDKPSQEAMDAYNVTLVQAIREKNIEALRTMLKDGKSLDACNRFGESILAMACRRGDVETVRFLVSEAKVKVSVRDDFGRLPHHDCCWTPVPNFRAMDVLLQVSPPELLISQDVRGHTPFHYARREHWDDWLHFLEERSDKIVKALNELTPKAEATAATNDETTTKTTSSASTPTGPATAALASITAASS